MKKLPIIGARVPIIGAPAILGLSLGDKPHAYWVEFEPGSDNVAKMKERDTYKCQHCGFTVIHERKDQPQAICKGCMEMVCEQCAPKGSCGRDNPNLEEQLARAEAAELARKSYGF